MGGGQGGRQLARGSGEGFVKRRLFPVRARRPKAHGRKLGVEREQVIRPSPSGGPSRRRLSTQSELHRSVKAMSWKQFVASVIAAVAWPTVVLILAFTLRTSLVELIVRLKKFKHKDTEIEFEERVKQIEAQVAPVKKSPATAVQTGRLAQIDRLYDMVSISPRAAIVEAWIFVEASLSRIANQIDGFEKNWRSIPSTALLGILRDRGVIEDRIYRALQEMRILRNRAAHTEDLVLTAEGASRYLDLAKEVISTLEESA